MRKTRLAKSLLALFAGVFLVLAGLATAAPAQASVIATTTASISAGATANSPISNSGCYPSGVSSNYSVVSFSTTSASVGTFRADIGVPSGTVVAALYDGDFLANNTVANCLKRTVTASAGSNAAITWSAKASSDSSDGHGWSLVLFGDAGVEADVSLTSNGTVSIKGEPLAVQFDGFAQLVEGESVTTTVQAINGNPPYEFGAQGLPDGLNLDPTTGVISGSPAEAGAFTPTISVKDSSAVPILASRQLQLSVAAIATPEPTSAEPSESPTTDATETPTAQPTAVPTSAEPSETPTAEPTAAPSESSQASQPVKASETTQASSTPSSSASSGELPNTGPVAGLPLIVGAAVLLVGLGMLSVLKRRGRRA